MKDKKPETTILIEEEPESSSLLSSERVSTEGRNSSATHKRLRKINPLGMRVVVCIRQQENTTDAGLYLPESARQSMSEALLAEVVEVASALDDETQEESNISGIPLGALVLIGKDAGVKVPWNENLRIIETKHIFATVHEVEIT